MHFIIFDDGVVIYRNINTEMTHKLLDALKSVKEMWEEELERFKNEEDGL
jgi:hypothetical protein